MVLRVEAGNPAQWAFEVDNTSTSVVTRLLCDPVAAFSSPPPATVFENETKALVAANATVNTVVGSPVPTVTYKWDHAGPIAIMDLPFCGPSQTRTITTPGVYADTAVPITLTVGFDTTCAGIGSAFLARAVTAAPMTIQPRPQQMALVLDRSGSMGLQGRWDNAQTAGRMLTNLFAELREDVHSDDRVGIVVFEDDVCAWHGPPMSAEIAPVLPPSKLSDAESAICGLAFGGPGSCTPIGDGLVAGMDMLIAGDPNDPNPTDPDPTAKFTIILLTDGEENAGTVQVGPGVPQPGVTTFAKARVAGKRSSLNPRLRLFTVGLGSTVDEQVLNGLAQYSAGQYKLITRPTQLAAAFGEMLTVSQEVKERVIQLNPPMNVIDPNPPTPPANAVYFMTSTGADRLALAVLASSGTIQLARWQGSDFVPEGVVRPCTDHIIGSVSNVGALGSGAIVWRVVHEINGTDQPLPVENVLAYEDLHVKADLRLDKPEYQTGDQMRLEVRLRHDADPILNAKVRAVLDAPAVGRGDTLTAVGPKFRFDPHGEDPATLKTAMIEEVFARNGWKEWPRTRPTGPFVDGTDLLHDTDGDGNYTNSFAKVFKEGTYTWEIFVEGLDVKGNPFDQRLAASTHAAVKVNRGATRVTVTKAGTHPSGMQAAQVAIIPQDARGERLGPGWDHAVIWSLEDGVFEHVLERQPAPVFTDGSYQRVILYHEERQRPVLRISAVGTVLRKIAVRDRLGDDDKT